MPSAQAQTLPIDAARQDPFAWPEPEEALRLPRGPACEHLLQTLIWTVRDQPPAGSGVGGSVLMLDALLVILDLLQRSPAGVAVDARTVLQRKGYRRWGRERRAFEERLSEQLIGLDALVRQLAGEREPLLVFAPRNVARTHFMVRPGGALAAELQAHDWAELGPAVLRLDHRKNREADALAKKLAVALVHVPVGQVLRVRDLLRLAGERPCADQRRRSQHLGERFAAALTRLSALGLSRLTLEPPADRAPGWFEDWCEAEAQVGVAPTPIAARPRRKGSAARARNNARPRGRPPFSPTPDQRALVASLSAKHCTRAAIAERLRVSLPTLRRYFAAELATADQMSNTVFETQARAGGDFLQLFDALLVSARSSALGRRVREPQS